MAAKKSDKTLQIIGLIINILVLPGLGSIIGGRMKEGIWQLAILFGSFVVGVILTITIVGAVIGIPLMVLGPIAAWIWALVTGIQMVQ